MKMVLASKNAHKLVEMKDILSQLGVEVVLESDEDGDVDGEETARLRRVDFQNDQGEYIQIRVMALTETAAYTYDSESGEGERVAIGDYEGRLIDEGPYTLLFWVDEQRGEATMILASALPQEELFQLARALRY